MRFTRNAASAVMVKLEMGMARWRNRYRFGLLTSGIPLSAEPTAKYVEQLPKGKAQCPRLARPFVNPKFRTCCKW
jgi:hypothetical protein